MINQSFKLEILWQWQCQQHIAHSKLSPACQVHVPIRSHEEAGDSDAECHAGRGPGLDAAPESVDVPGNTLGPGAEGPDSVNPRLQFFSADSRHFLVILLHDVMGSPRIDPEQCEGRALLRQGREFPLLFL